MADYIHKNILSEAYVHIDVVHLTAEQKRLFETQLMLFTESRGKFAIYDDIVPEIRTKDGSLKVYSSITGTLTEALGDFATFDEALDNLYVDAKRLAEAMILETLFLSKIRGKKVLRREARTGIIRSTKDLFDHIELARHGTEDDSPRSARRRIAEITSRATKLLDILASEEDKDLIKREATIKVKSLLVPFKIQESQITADKASYQGLRKQLMALLT